MQHAWQTTSRGQVLHRDRLCCCTQAATTTAKPVREDWRVKSKPIQPGKSYPAKELCSNCGLCDTYYVAHVNNACAFLGSGMSKIDDLESRVHGRTRDLENEDELHFGIHTDMLYAQCSPPVQGAQWTGIVTRIAIEMLQSGKVEAVVCVQSQDDDRFAPKPLVARTVDDIIKARGVKPTLSPNLNTLATVEALGVKRLLFIGVGCQVQALRAVEPHLGLEKLYILGTNCVDNGPRKGLEKFLNAASTQPDTVSGYEFMQDYKVHIKHTDGFYERIPYFCLPANDLNDVIAPSCYSCFDYVNNLADMVVGYMGVPYHNVEMTAHPQYITVRNQRGQEMLDSIGSQLVKYPTMSSGKRQPFVMQTVIADDEAKQGRGPDPAPRWVGDLVAYLLLQIGPKGLEFGRYSIEYHYIRNWLYSVRHLGLEKARQRTPSFAQKIVARYNKDGAISRRLQPHAAR
ncbi:hypothetical protein WJX73_001217 [Symbiochloris irregularis]|uniref:Coenzyme F420 hydrogenase n=1 Tax=Symbiochloris irregularis TaxID=706552 RepID=A0AAW1NRM9_9CHLO